MATPIYLWLFEEDGKLIKGNVDVNGREGSIELTGMQHNIFIPNDQASGTITSLRQHEAYTFEKEVDSSSPLLYRALTTGRNLAKAILRYYRINDNGMEEEYFNVVLDNVKVCHILPIMFDVRDDEFENHGHIEHVGLRYEKITWLYTDRNIQHSDKWASRKNV